MEGFADLSPEAGQVVARAFRSLVKAGDLAEHALRRPLPDGEAIIQLVQKSLEKAFACCGGDEPIFEQMGGAVAQAFAATIPGKKLNDDILASPADAFASLVTALDGAWPPSTQEMPPAP